MNEEKQPIEILRSFDPSDLADFSIYMQETEKTANLIKKQQKEIKKSKRRNK